MRSMLQLLGGVAVAGAVAAGATAFTASGVTMDAAVTPAKLFLGGGVTTTVTGTTVSDVVYHFADAPTTKTQLDKITLTFADANAGAGKVTLVTTGTGATQPTWTCDDIGTSFTSKSVCTASGAFQLNETNHVTNMVINVFPA